jgi:hypothetical protein
MTSDPTDPYIGFGDDSTDLTDPTRPPDHAGGEVGGWWDFVDGAWRWITMPLPGTIARIGCGGPDPIEPYG